MPKASPAIKTCLIYNIILSGIGSDLRQPSADDRLHSTRSATVLVSRGLEFSRGRLLLFHHTVDNRIRRLRAWYRLFRYRIFVIFRIIVAVFFSSPFVVVIASVVIAGGGGFQPPLSRFVSRVGNSLGGRKQS